MTIESPVIIEGIIPARYTCDGDDINPPLIFSDIPENTKSLVLIMEDRDVPQNLKPDGLWIHWLLWNMPANIKEIGEGSEPDGEVGKNSSGSFGYQGPCPPDREHRYFFRLFALDTVLDLPIEEATRESLEKAMRGHILEQAELIGRYKREGM